MKPTKTPEELTRIGKIVHAMLSEVYDDFLIVGFIAGTGQPLQVTNVVDEKGRYALEFALTEIEIPNKDGIDSADKDDEANT